MSDRFRWLVMSPYLKIRKARDTYVITLNAKGIPFAI